MSQSILKWVTKKPANPQDTQSCQNNPSTEYDTQSSADLTDQQLTLNEAHSAPRQEKVVAADILQEDTCSGIPEIPNQPKISFPQRSFGKQKRSFCSSWYEKYPWLHYHAASDTVFCFHCLVAEKRALPITAYKDEMFTKTGFSNWKKALDKFDKHSKSKAHSEAFSLVGDILKSTKDVGELLSAAHESDKAENRKSLMTIISSIRFLGRQGLPLRGDYYKADGACRDDGELNSNLLQLLKARCEDNPSLKTWLLRSQNKYTSPEIQNELLKILALEIQREVVDDIRGKWFTIMVDETTDMSNTEQMVFCLRYVDEALEVHEEFLGLHSLESTDADTITATIKDILLRLNLNIHDCRGQCYDGASSMSGKRTGVATQVSSLEPKALYTHCYGHALNLAVQDTLKNISVMRDTLNTVHEITKLIKKSPKRDAIFKNIQAEVNPGSPGVRVLCPTRWTVRADALKSILGNYEALQLTWDAAKEATKDTEYIARIGGVSAAMEKFEFFFGLQLGSTILNMVDNLSRTIQSKSISACEAQNVVSMTVKSIKAMRSTPEYELFWEKVEKEANCQLGIADPRVPRHRKVPRRYEIGESVSQQVVNSAKDHYKLVYFEALDLSVVSIQNRFDQKGYHMMQKIEKVLVDFRPQQLHEDGNDLSDVVEFYGKDINKNLLIAQLTILHQVNDRSFADISSLVEYLKDKSQTERIYLSEVLKLVQLILVAAATNAVSERSFSALRRMKTWLRTTMSQTRLNWCMLLHVHSDKTDSLVMSHIANEFVSRNENRLSIFGHFQ